MPRFLLVLLALAITIACIAWPAHKTTAPTAEPTPVAPVAAPAPTMANGITREAAPTAPEPVRDVAIDGEWRDDGWRERVHAVAPGELHVLVLRGQRPVADATVRLWSDPSDASTVPAFGTTPALHQTRTDARGEARFERLPAAHYTVRADTEGQAVAASTKVVDGVTQATSESVVLLFGTATLRGTVLDAGGAPHVGVAVHVTGIGPQPERATMAGTDRDGRYVLAGLHGGRYHVQVRLPGPWSPDHERMLSLLPGATARLDFGPVGPQFPIRGRIVDADGQTVFGRRALHFVHDEHNDERRHWTADDGTFAATLPGGRWRIAREHAAEPLTTIAVPTATPCDVVWPGLRLLVRVPRVPELGPHAMRGGLHLDQQAADDVRESDGLVCLQWLDLQPGTRRLIAGNSVELARAPAAGIEVALRDERKVVVIDCVAQVRSRR